MELLVGQKVLCFHEGEWKEAVVASGFTANKDQEGYWVMLDGKRIFKSTENLLVRE